MGDNEKPKDDALQDCEETVRDLKDENQELKEENEVVVFFIVIF